MTEQQHIFSLFLPDELVGEIRPLGRGNINDTFIICNPANEPQWLLQRINHHVFPRVEVLQHNLDVVSRTMARHYATDPDARRKYLYFYPVAADPTKNYVQVGENYWRLCRFIADSVSLNEVNPDTARSAGWAFGQFESILATIPEGELGETIINFHHVSFRIEELQEAVRRNVADRLTHVCPWVDELLARSHEFTHHERLYAAGMLPKRTIHCDTKVDNILFDARGEVLCVVDWDTVMPGFILSDVGDFIRTGVCSTPEDEPDIDRIAVKADVYHAFVEGYVQAADFLTETEKSLIPYAGRMMTYMQAVRFLTDYLNGDTYYKVTDPEHNYRRTRAQITYLHRLDDFCQSL